MKQHLTPYEAEADELTVAVTGATPLLNALQKLGGSQWARSPMHNRWTSHGTWTHCVSLIRQLERSANSRWLARRLPSGRIRSERSNQGLVCAKALAS